MAIKWDTPHIEPIDTTHPEPLDIVCPECNSPAGYCCHDPDGRPITHAHDLRIFAERG
jgi:hypothetical protein